MKKLNANGIIIQEKTNKNNIIKNFNYLGINAFSNYPLTCINDIECKKITEEQQTKKICDNQYLFLEFISNIDLYRRYIKRCVELNIDVRVLFIESDYKAEIWPDKLPEMEFLGYEYCTIPVDEQIITDMDWYHSFSKYRNQLNEYGLFNTYDEAKRFVDDYNRAFYSGEVGDGEMDAYILRISRVREESLIKK